MRDPLPDLEIRLARRADALAIDALRRAVVAEGRWFVSEPGEWRENPRVVADLIGDLARSANGFALAACAGGRVVGVLLVQGGSLNRLYHVGRLEMMVAAAHRGRGVGRALMDAALERAARGPLVKLSLAVFAHNEPAVALYERCGFQVEGRRRREYRIDGAWADDLLMCRFLDEG